MSYGVWRKRGKGWSSIEIDTPGNHYPSLSELSYSNSKREPKQKQRWNNIYYRCMRNGINIDTWCDDIHQLAWECSQKEKDRDVVSVSLGDHSVWIGYDDRKSLDTALEKLWGGKENEGYYENEIWSARQQADVLEKSHL